MLDIVVFQITVLSVQKREFKQNIAVEFCLCNLKLLKFKKINYWTVDILYSGSFTYVSYSQTNLSLKLIQPFETNYSGRFTWYKGPKFRQHSLIKGRGRHLSKTHGENGGYWRVVSCTDGLCSEDYTRLKNSTFQKVGYILVSYSILTGRYFKIIVCFS